MLASWNDHTPGEALWVSVDVRSRGYSDSSNWFDSNILRFTHYTFGKEVMVQMAKQKTKAAGKKAAFKTKTDASAIHIQHKDGVPHLVGFGNIRVIIVPDGAAFFAQGLEIDYAAQGSSVDEVKSNFEVGLEATVDQHLKIYGNIKGLLQPAPAAIWQELVPEKTALHNSYWHVSEHTIEHSALPYEGINYLVAAVAQNAA